VASAVCTVQALHFRVAEQTGAIAMPTSKVPTLWRIEGILERVDLVNREIELVERSTRRTLVVSPDCEVVLHGERVKLRMLQPGDRVRILYSVHPNLCEAHRLEAQSDDLSSDFFS
jgi:hypothetical protein